MQVKYSLSQLGEILKQKLKQPLPGALAHEPLRATPVGSVFPDFNHKSPPKPGAVLILLYEKDGEILFPLIQRSEYTGAHSGQISLPGGKVESGEDFFQTALREGQEEIGINPNTIEIIGRLSDFFVIPSNFMVVPVIAISTQQPQFTADPVEVQSIISGSLFSLLDDDAINTKEIIAAGMYRMNAPHFEVEGQIVWGATAMILNELRTLIKY